MRIPRVVRASLLGTLLGGLVGFVLGLLVAPTPGRETRRRAAYLLDRWTGQVSDLLNTLDAEAEGMARETRLTGEDLVDKARDEASQLSREADALLREARQRRVGTPRAADSSNS